jgi:hypothetical protein
MKFRIVACAVMMLPVACNRHKDSNPVVEPTPSPTPSPAPKIVFGLQGQPTAASVQWDLPEFLKGQFQDKGYPFLDAALDLDLTRGEEKHSSRLLTGFAVASCDPAAEIALFVSSVGKDPAENMPDALKSDIEVIESWKGDSQDFKGKILLKKSYKSGNETGLYRLDAVFANEKSKECLFWNFVLQPVAGVSAEFIESSTEYQQLVESLATTWKGVGVDFDE